MAAGAHHPAPSAESDYEIAVGVLVYYSILIGLANLIVDLVYPLLDPRIRL